MSGRRGIEHEIIWESYQQPERIIRLKFEGHNSCLDVRYDISPIMVCGISPLTCVSDSNIISAQKQD